MDPQDTSTAKYDEHEPTVSSTIPDNKNTGADVSPTAAPADGPSPSPPRKEGKVSKPDFMLTADVEALKRAQSLLEADDNESAGSVAKALLEPLGDLSALSDNLCAFSGAAFVLGKSLVRPLLTDGNNDNAQDLLVPLRFFELALRLDPENEEAEEYVDAISQMIPEDNSASEKHPAPEKRNHSSPFDVIVIGAGASGVGMGIMLTHSFELDPARVLLVERGAQVGLITQMSHPLTHSLTHSLTHLFTNHSLTHSLTNSFIH